MSTPDFGHTEYARDRRAQKATRLEAHLHAVGLPPWAPTVADLPEADRRTVERAAGVRRASEETWALVHQLFERARRA